MFSSCLDKGTVALTYDDGPTDFSPYLLDTLSAYNITATFFVIGEQLEDAAYVADLQRAYAAGHMIAAHTYTHPSLITLSAADIESEMTKTSDIIFSTIGVRPRFMRPPYGDVNDTVISIVTGMDYRMTLWNLDTVDWSTLSAQVSLSTISSSFATYAGQESVKSWIILQHEIVLSTTQGQGPIIDFIRTYPYRFVTIEECEGLGNSRYM